MVDALAEASWFARMGITVGLEVISNCVMMSFTQVIAAGLSTFAGPNSQSALAYAAEQSDCEQVGVMQQQTQQLNGLVDQADKPPDEGQNLARKMRFLRASTLVYAQSLAEAQRRFRTRATVAIIVNIYITLVLIFWILKKSQKRRGVLSHAEVDLSILEAARRDAALAANLEQASVDPLPAPLAHA